MLWSVQSVQGLAVVAGGICQPTSSEPGAKGEPAGSIQGQTRQPRGERKDRAGGRVQAGAGNTSGTRQPLGGLFTARFSPIS